MTQHAGDVVKWLSHWTLPSRARTSVLLHYFFFLVAVQVLGLEHDWSPLLPPPLRCPCLGAHGQSDLTMFIAPQAKAEALPEYAGVHGVEEINERRAPHARVRNPDAVRLAGQVCTCECCSAPISATVAHKAHLLCALSQKSEALVVSALQELHASVQGLGHTPV